MQIVDRYFAPGDCALAEGVVGGAGYRRLLRPNGTLAAQGVKQGFCFEDSFKYGPNKSNGYTCQYQGITSGWGDWCYKQLVGHWIDITGVPEGDYRVRVTINSSGIFGEGSNLYANVVETFIHVPDPRNKVDIVE